jgi:hypothetical protein
MRDQSITLKGRFRTLGVYEIKAIQFAKGKSST